MDHYTRDETEAQKLDRNWSELLQELRVSQTGVQVLTGFLLTLPLQPEFHGITTLERNFYVAAISFSILATVLLVAPVSMHRVLFRKRRKESLVEVGAWVAKAGLVALALASATVAAFVFSLVFTDTVGVWVGAATLIVFALAWLVLPLVMRAPESD
ncbi:hypothetical protein SAMN05216199_3085 [Pedococcus cremeus]|uniref:Sodium:proton antiporter n=1 Tax=Pedococcus cremeus TaxID=587636 RepID=A0A1H9WR17_9MICO|nr:DUF6328 family protein [Pedococcus cremeus]SES35833.1 hypothetical protein SAMN05216199_3085 [Pedococcus cremeus]